MARQGFMNTGGQCHDVSVPGADEDARVRLTGPVKAEEVAPVESEYRASLRGGKCEHSVIRGPTISLPCFLYCQYVVAEAVQLFDDRMVKILIGIEARHRDQAASSSWIAWSISSWCCA